MDLWGRKAVMKDGAATKALATAMAADARLNGGHLADLAADLGAAVERYGTTTALLGKELSQNPPRALANAHEYLNMVGHTVVAWLWLREAAAAAKGFTFGHWRGRALLRGQNRDGALLQAPSSKYAGAGGSVGVARARRRSTSGRGALF